MTESRYIARSKAIAARTIGDVTMVMSASDSTLFTLDEVASVIWAAADGVTPLDTIVREKVCSQYEVAPEVALKDAEELVETLASRGILLVSSEPLVASGARRENP